MGSSGSGSFGTYRGEGAGSVANGGQLGEIECPLNIENIKLEDVGISSYYLFNHNVPPVNSIVELSMKLVNKRLVVVLSTSQEVIGNLPVKYNYLNICMKRDYKYSGSIKASGLTPIPYIVVNLHV